MSCLSQSYRPKSICFVFLRLKAAYYLCLEGIEYLGVHPLEQSSPRAARMLGCSVLPVLYASVRTSAVFTDYVLMSLHSVCLWAWVLFFERLYENLPAQGRNVRSSFQHHLFPFPREATATFLSRLRQLVSSLRIMLVLGAARK